MSDWGGFWIAIGLLGLASSILAVAFHGTPDLIDALIWSLQRGGY